MNVIKIDGKEIPVSQYRNDWALALMSQGVIIELNIHWWRGVASLKPEELGIKFSNDEVKDFAKKYIRLGSENLLPPEMLYYIKNADLMARNNLRDYGFDTIWGKFVPFTAFSKWQENDLMIRKEFFEASTKLCDQYDIIVEIVRNEYKKMAKDVWNRLYQNTNPTESFIEDFISKIVSKIPSKNKIFSSFKYETNYFMIPLPSFIQEDLNKKEILSYNLELEKETKKKIADEYVKRKQEYIDDFLESTVSSIRSHVSELCDNVIECIAKSKSINDVDKKQRDKIRKIIRKVKLINFYNDKEINTMLKDVENEIDKIKGERNKGIIVEKLQKIVDLSKKEFLPDDFNPIVQYLEV